ncbi:hypothetical protein OROMI_033996 [Orobanche minor]
MASSQTSSQSLKKTDHIIDGRLFSRSTVLDRIKSETEDLDSMERIVSKIKQQGLYCLGCMHSDLYDEHIVEELYLDASVKLFSRKQGEREKVNWCQFVLKRLSEEVIKPSTQKKYFDLIINNILTQSGVSQSHNAKKISPGKFNSGCKPTVFNRAGLIGRRPHINILPTSKNPKDISGSIFLAEKIPKKRKQSVSDCMSPLTEIKKLKKALKPNVKETETAPVTVYDLSLAQPADHHSQGATPVIESTAFRSKDPEPTTTMMDHPIFTELESLDESTAHIELIVTSPVQTPLPEHDPSLNRVPSPVRDPTPNRVPTPVRDSSPKQTPIPVEDPIHIVNPIPVRSPSPSAHTFITQVEQAFEWFVKWKSYRIALYDVMFNWKEWKEEELFILDQARLKEQGKTDDICFKADSKMSRDIAPEEEILETFQCQGNSKIISSLHHQLEQVVTESFQEEAKPPVQQAYAHVSTIVPIVYEVSLATPQEESVPLSE